MSEIQLSMLRQDYEELQEYIAEITERGKAGLASKLRKKLSYLESKISEHT